MNKQPPATNYLQRSLTYMHQFGQENFTPFFHALDNEYRGQIPREHFSTQWPQVIQAFGAQQKVLHSAVFQEDGNTIVEITTLHILRKLITNFTYSGAGTVIGCSLRLAPLDVSPQSGETWEEHAIRVGPLEKKLNGLLTLPRGVEKPSVILLLQGSGPSNLNEQVGLGGNKPFEDIAHGLAARGVASIRYDKRSYAYPEDAIYAGVELEYLDDADDAIRLLREDPRVDGSRIFLLGHSEGGMIGPEILRRNPKIRGFVSLAGTLRRLEDLMLEQVKKILADAQTLSEDQKQDQLAAMEQAVRQIKSSDNEEETTMIAGASVRYWRSLNAIDAPAIMRQLDIPTLILQGGEDFQVLAHVDYPLWQDTLSGKTNVTFHLYPTLNHLFMPGGTKDHIDLSVYNTPSHVDQEVIRDIASWVNLIL